MTRPVVALSFVARAVVALTFVALAVELRRPARPPRRRRSPPGTILRPMLPATEATAGFGGPTMRRLATLRAVPRGATLRSRRRTAKPASGVAVRRPMARSAMPV
jgi:hypothetical protein